ncbi:hypothetical protein P7C70_g8183, partial [Phenoliferia sp. Uapishka_3]
MISHLAEELLSAITNQLIESFEEDEETAPHINEAIIHRQNTGASLCLVSRRLLPYGRRVLYSHLDSRDGRVYDQDWEHGNPALRTLFYRRLKLLGQHPYLASFVESCTIELQDGAITEEELGELGLVFKSCTNLRKFTLLETSLPSEPWDEDPGQEAMEEWNRRDSARETLFRYLVDTQITSFSKLRHLSLTMNSTSGYRQRLIKLLCRCPDLRSLDIQGLEDLLKCRSDDDSPQSILLLPNLRELSASTCHNKIIAEIIAASPELRTFFLHTSQDYILPTISTPHPTLAELTINFLHNPDNWNHPNFETSTQLEKLTPFISSFPSITKLNLTLNIAPRDRPIIAVAPSTSDSLTFFTSLPHSITTLILSGQALNPVILDLTTLLPSTPLPNLTELSLYWKLQTGGSGSATVWKDLIAACRACDIKMGGNLGMLDRLQNTVEDLESLLELQREFKEEMIERRAKFMRMVDERNAWHRDMGLAEVPLSLLPDPFDLKPHDARAEEMREQLDSIKALIWETFS